MDTITFAAIRYLLVPEQQNIFAQPLSGEQKQELIIKALFSFDKIKAFKTRRRAEGAISIIENENNVYFGKFARKIHSKRYTKTDTDIIGEKFDSWPFLIFSCDTNPQEQLLVIEQKSGYFSPRTICQIIKDITFETISLVGYQLDLKIIPREGAFWEIIDQSPKIYSIKFSVNSPNFLGAHFNSLKLAGKMANTFHSTRNNFEIENDNGDLIVPRESLGDLLDLTQKGCASWSIKAGPEVGKPKMKRSTDKIKTVEVNIAKEDLESGNKEVFKKIGKSALEKMR